jgi:hypothetical protein
MQENKIIVSVFILLLAFTPLLAQEKEGYDLDFGRFRIASTPKILDDGLQNDFLFGLFYTDAMKLAGDLRVRYINGSETNVTFWDIEDSMLNRSRQVIEVFLLPVNYYFVRKAGFSIHAGIGGYYNYSKLNENGFFNDKELYDDPAAMDNYNAYTNDFTAHAVGPLLDIGINYRNSFFYGALSFGSVPIHYLDRKQTWKLSPFMYPNPTYTVESKSRGGPYFYFNFDAMFDLIIEERKYVSFLFSLLGETSKLKYTAAGFNDTTGEWADVEEEIENKVLHLEISLLIHLGKSGIMPQIGYGRTFNETTGGSNYLLIGARKEFF